jgi:hypothetical protein
VRGFKRPQARVLRENALIPEGNLISPAPNQFTHELTRAQPFYYADARKGAQPNGEFPTGTKVVLLVRKRGGYCRVADERGLYVEIACDSLKKL